MKLAVLATHPIQYQVPFFKALGQHPEINLEVFFCHDASAKEQAQAGFGVEFNWDRLALEGFEYRFLKNVSASPSIHSFNGLDNPEFKQIIAEDRFDAVMVNGWNYRSAWQAIRKCWKTQTPIMVRSDSHLLTDRSWSRRTMKWPLYRWFIPRLDACLPVGTLSTQYFRHYGASEKKVFVVPHSIDDDHFSSQAKALRPVRNELRHSFGLHDEAIAFLFAGKFIESKGPITFVRAVEKAARDNPKIVGLMVGDGPLRAEIETFIKTTNAPVRLVGFLNQSEIVRSYVAADALVLPSNGETWGLVVNEAMTCGLPCIVSDKVGCGPDLIRDETGAVFPLDDPDALAALIVKWSNEPETIAGMGKAAGKLMASYSVERAVQLLVQAVHRVQAE
ncbi:MAG TPA: glycosyltransferase family 4 protein [Pyrinomonadaceae bacterium]